ncbi:MAG: nucleotide sugar dehydrogenase, partial [Lactobacillus sp.]|nr:nucleotide sugar dehydrogenase [Lactobacillus sp.]
AADFDVVSIPEFLREGFAVYDFFNPDRIVIGTNSERAKEVIAKLYEYFKGKTEILYVNRRSSETIKYASNAFLAMKIHYINEMSDFCEKAGADVYEVARGMGLDSRIGDRFLNAGPGYGGGCFPKDTKAMAFMGRKYGSELSLIETTIEKNAQRKRNMAKRVLDVIKGIDKPKVAIWGLAFKGGTDDCRESPAIEVIEPLIEFGLDIKAYDPKAMENARLILGDKISYAANEYEAAKGADVLVVLTEWKDFQKVDMVRIRDEMRNNIIVDLRNLLDEKGAKNLGFIYKSIGRV